MIHIKKGYEDAMDQLSSSSEGLLATSGVVGCKRHGSGISISFGNRSRLANLNSDPSKSAISQNLRTEMKNLQTIISLSLNYKKTD